MTIPHSNMTEDTTIRKAWRIGNDNGEGFPIGDDDDEPMEAAQRAGLQSPREVDGLDGGIVCGWDGDRLIAIADSSGPWAVDITDACADYYRDTYRD